MRGHAGQSGAAFAIIDLLITVTLIAVVLVLVVPRLRDTSYVRVLAAAQILSSDLELARQQSIASPGDPLVVRFGPDPAPGHEGAASYWLARASTPDDPIERGEGLGPYRVTFGFGRARSAEGVAIVPDADVGDTLTFNGFGGLDNAATDPGITLSLGSRWARLNISATTGSVTEVPDGG